MQTGHELNLLRIQAVLPYGRSRSLDHCCQNRLLSLQLPQSTLRCSSTHLSLCKSAHLSNQIFTDYIKAGQLFFELAFPLP